MMVSGGWKVAWCVLVFLLAVLNAPLAFTQAVTGTILGRVTDTTGAVMPGAAVQVQNVETDYSQTAQTDSEGRYLVRNLPLGSYSVTIQQAGFRTEVRRGITLTVGSEVTINAQLAVGNIEERVEVTGEASPVETTNATVSGLVNQEQMRDLPLNGRNIDQLALLSPGVWANRNYTNTVTTGLGMHLSINGDRPSSTLYLLDGTVVNDHTNNGRGGVAGVQLGVEGILEFRLLTHNFSAEYGRSSGGVLSAVTRSGTNEFHGSAFEFVRNNVFDARNFFNPGDLPPFRRNQFGGTLGGRIIRDKLFFFLNYEGLRQVQGNTVIASVPDVPARSGLLPTGPVDPGAGKPTLQQVTVNPSVVPYLKLYPLPNGGNHGDGTADFIEDFGATASDDYAMERMDYRLSDKDNFFWRYVYDYSTAVFPKPLPTFVNPYTGTDYLLVLSETHIFSGSSLNEFRGAFNRLMRQSDNNSVTPIDPSLSLIPGQPFGVFTMSSQLTDLGSLQQTAWHRLNLFQESDTFSTVRGAHSLKFGGDVERQQNNNLNISAGRGQYLFAGLSQLLAGASSRFNGTLVSGPPNLIGIAQRGWRRTLFAWFVQDDFRVRPNLTLNLGLRHEFWTAANEVNGLSESLRHLTDPKMTLGPEFVPSKLNFAPRAGLAWDPTGSGKTSVRLGTGVYFNHLDGQTWFSSGYPNADFSHTYNINNPLFPNFLANGYPPQSGAQLTQGVQFHPPTPTVIHYSLDVQRQLQGTLSLKVGYIGSHGYNLPRNTQQDIRVPTILPDGTQSFLTTSPFINPNFSSIILLLDDTHSNYNALQATLQKTFSAGLQFQANYTYSKAMADSDGQGLTSEVPAAQVDPFNIGREYSLAAFDQRHKFLLNGSYQMPWEKWLTGKLAKAALGGWAINGVFTVSSGHPFTALSGFNNSQNGDAAAPDRPNGAPGFSNNPNHGVTAGCQGVKANQKLGTPNLWFDPCAFVLPAAGLYGNLGRNTVIGPGFSNIDFTLVKTTTLTERMKLDFRAEFFNLLNHANFGLPNIKVFNSSRARSGNAGQVIATDVANRQIQLGMKLIF